MSKFALNVTLRRRWPRRAVKVIVTGFPNKASAMAFCGQVILAHPDVAATPEELEERHGDPTEEIHYL